MGSPDAGGRRDEPDQARCVRQLSRWLRLRGAPRVHGLVLADAGRTCIAYLRIGDKLGVQMEAGRYDVAWYDCTRGDWIDGGT